MSNAIFPALPGRQWDISKKAVWSSIVQTAVSGMELRGSYFQYPLWHWTLQHDFLRADRGFTEFQTLAGFFNARQGVFDSFLYDDLSDDLIADVPPYMTFGAGDGATLTFQLGRALGGVFEPIYNVNGTARVYVNGTLMTLGSDYTLSGAGLVTFAAAPAAAAVIAWSGAYYWRVRFSASTAEFVEFASNFWKLGKIEFQSVKGQ